MKAKAKSKTATMVGVGLGAVGLMVAGVLVSKRLKSPITSITTSSTECGKLDIAWYDDEKDAMYKIYWSNRKGVRISDPNTYLHSIQVTTLTQMGDSMHHRARISLSEEWVYVVIAKKGYTSSEFEARILQRKEFSIANLNIDVLKRPKDGDLVSMLVAVLDKVEAYRILIYLPGGKCESYDFDAKNLDTVSLKFPALQDSLVHIAAKIAGIWTAPEFLIYYEKI